MPLALLAATVRRAAPSLTPIDAPQASHAWRRRRARLTGIVTPLTLRAASLTLVAGLATLAAPSAVGAQLPPLPERARSEPSVWVSGGVGYFQAESVADGSTQSAWELNGNTAQWHAAVEAAVSRGFSLGVSGGFASVPSRYVTIGSTPTPPVSGSGACLDTGSCQTTVDVVSLRAIGRFGGGRGLHQVLELALGVNQFRNFRTDDGTRLAPERDTDFAGSVGYGFGYGFSDLVHVTLVQEFGFNAHQREALPRGANSLTQQRVTRLAVRFGFAERRVR